MKFRNLLFMQYTVYIEKKLVQSHRILEKELTELLKYIKKKKKKGIRFETLLKQDRFALLLICFAV